jgi:geranylgeranylglycerol-phosphate geranylgeranyltransferase
MLAVVYSHTLKKSPFFGNFFIAFSMAIPFIFGNLSVTETLLLPVSFLASLALIMGVGREIAKSIMDYAGDRKQRRFTLPIAIGKQNASYISAFFILFAVLISPLPFFYFAQYYFDYLYLVPILITDVLLVVSLCLILGLKKLKDVRFLTLVAQGTGLAGFLLGAIF